MKTKMLSFVLAVCLLVCTVASCGHEHNWTDATCLAPKTCSECGETEGEALGHKWNDATCKSGKFCSACGITEGNVLDHTFVSEACSGCGLAASEYYDNALTAINDGEYAVAYKMLSVLGGYRDSADLIKYFRYVPTKHILAEDTFVEWSYNDKNLPIQIVTTYGVGIREVFGFTYDADGNLTKYTYISGDGDVESLEYTYDENRNLIKKVATHSNLTTTYDYTYDENGNLTKSVYTNSENETSILNYTYDAYGNIIKEDADFSDGSDYITEYSYVYDAYGKMLKKIRRNPSGINEINDYTYDERGNVTKEVISNSTDGVRYTWEYTYNVKNELVKKVCVSQYNNKTWECTYDENGNLVKEVYKSSSGYQEVNEFAYKLVYFPHQMHSDFEEFVFSYLNFVED